MKYTVDYFIEKFSKIPKEKWCVEKFSYPDGRKCALGHCGVTLTSIPKEGRILNDIFQKYYNVWAWYINDGYYNIKNFSKYKHPKTRILNALKELKKKGIRA